MSYNLNKKLKICGFSEIISLKLKKRLMELGFIEGREIVLKRKSILKKVYLVEIMGYLLCVQKKILDEIRFGDEK